MTLREATALVLLYRSCASAVAREKAAALVPELLDAVDPVACAGPARVWSLTAQAEGGRDLGKLTVVSSLEDLPMHQRAFGMGFDLALGVQVYAEPI